MSALVTSAVRHRARTQLGEDALYAAWLSLAALNFVVLIDLAVRDESSVLQWVVRVTLERVGGT